MRPLSPSLVGRIQEREKGRDEVRERGGLKVDGGVRSPVRLGVSSTGLCLGRETGDDQAARWVGEEARQRHYLPTLLLKSAWMGY